MQHAEIQLKEYEIKLIFMKEALNEANEKDEANVDEIEKYTKSIASLEDDLETVSTEVESLVIQNESLEKEIESMLEKVKTSQGNETLAIEKANELQATLEQQTSMFQTLEAENESLFRENQQILQDLDICKGSLSQMTQYRDTLTTQLEMEKDHASELNIQIEKLQSQLADTRVNVDLVGSLQEEMAVIQKEKSAIASKLQIEKEHATKLDIQIQNLQSQLKDARNQADLTKSLEEEIETLKTVQQDKTAIERKLEIERVHSEHLNAQIEELQFNLSNARTRADLTESLEDQITALQDANQEKDTRLSGADRLVKIHDKECTRLLNDIESKTEEIESMKFKISDLETSNVEKESKINEQTTAIESLESLLVKNEQTMKETSEQTIELNTQRIDLQKRIDSLSTDVKDKEEKLCSLQNELKIASENSSKYTLPKESNIEANRNKVTFSTPDMSDPSTTSPSATEIETKHSELVRDLVKMKSIIRDAITPVKRPTQSNDQSSSPSEGIESLVDYFQQELHEKNKVLTFMEEQVDILMRDIEIANQSLTEKNDYISILENEKTNLSFQLNNMQKYVKQIEQSLCTELKRRRKLDSELKSLKIEKKSILVDCHSKSEALGEAKKALARKSRDVVEQVDVARQLAHQLQSTKNKIVALKAHLKREGLLQDTPKGKVTHKSTTASNAQLSRSQQSGGSSSSVGSICWTFSED